MALPESALGNLPITPRRCRAPLPVSREDDKARGRSCEENPEQVEDAGQKLGCELKKWVCSGIAASLTEKLVGEECSLVSRVVAKGTAEMVDAPSKFVEVVLEE